MCLSGKLAQGCANVGLERSNSYTNQFLDSTSCLSSTSSFYCIVDYASVFYSGNLSDFIILLS